MYMLNGNICFDPNPNRTAEQLSSLQPDPMLSNSDESGSSVASYKDCENIEMLSENAYHSSCDAGSSFTRSGPRELGVSRDSARFSVRGHRGSPASGSCHHEWNLNSEHQAKRARVEKIIKCMTSPPGAHSTDGAMNRYIESGGLQEKHGFDTASQSQMTREQRESQHQRLRQLRTRFDHVDRATDAVGIRNQEKYPDWNKAPETSWDACTDSYNESKSGSSENYQGLKKAKLMSNFQTKPERIKLMADVLKGELSRVVTKSVDSIFKSVPLLQVLPNVEGNIETDVSPQSSVCKVNSVKPAYGNAAGQVPEVWSLAVQKPRLERGDEFNLQARLRGHHPPKAPTSSTSFDSTLNEGERSEKKHNTAHHHHHPHALRRLQAGSKVTSRSVRSPHTRTASVEPMLLQNPSLPHVQVESDNLANNNMLNEGLTTNHLRKAKLMFFYTRYPSSLVLRRCFHDVQFTRCITSQLIKWFSNFREFYYIQTERFARRALSEGVADVRALPVGRESELFRALNMHYNRANDFQVPDRFLEIAEITLREFYVAISVGKDRGPSWKKAIYKVICKLDSDVPAEFKNHLSG